MKLPHRPTAHLAPADLSGPFGDAWAIKLPNPRTTPAGEATLSSWLLTAPDAHPVWHSYGVSLAHLRPVPGAPDAVLHYPKAQHELVVLALDPDRRLDDPHSGKFKVYPLTPANLVVQFHGLSDFTADQLCADLIDEFVNGRLNPDTDFRRVTMDWLRKTVAERGGIAP